MRIMNRQRNTRRKKMQGLLIRLIVPVGCFTLLYYLVDLGQLLDFMRLVPPWVLLLALSIFVFRMWLSALRWKIMNSDTVQHLSNWEYFRYTMISRLSGIFLPGSLGSDITRSILVLRAVDQQKGANLIAIIADRFIGLLSILLLGTLACISAPMLPERWKYLVVLLILIVGAILAIFLAVSDRSCELIGNILNRLGRLGQKGGLLLNDWRCTLAYYRSNPRKILHALALCFPMHGAWFFTVYVLALNIGMEVSFLTICIVTSLVWIITTIPLTFSGLGVSELSFVYLLSLQGVSSEMAVALSLYSFFITVLGGALGVSFILLERKTMNLPRVT